MEYLVKTYSDENDVVLTHVWVVVQLELCKNTNRKFIGIERDEKYFNTAKERISTKDLTLFFEHDIV